MDPPPGKSLQAQGALFAPLPGPPPICTWNECEEEILVWDAGWILFATGLLLRVRAQAHLHYRIGIRKSLTKTGLFSLPRKPIYLGNTMILTTLCVGGGLLWLAPIYVLYCCLVYTFAVGREERRLLGKYGLDYRDYVERIPRWIPRLALPESPGTADARTYLVKGLLVETPCLLLVLPFLAKELIT